MTKPNEDTPEKATDVRAPEVTRAADCAEEAPKPPNEPRTPEDEIYLLRKQIEELTEKAEQYHDEAARAKADFYNYRTRVERDRARDRVLAAEGTVDLLLPVLDNLDRTLEAVTDKESGLYKGVSMVQRQFFSALQSLGLEIIDTSGDFDPALHDAVAAVATGNPEEAGKILEVMYRGYRLGEKVLRAAQVKVAKAE